MLRSELAFSRWFQAGGRQTFKQSVRCVVYTQRGGRKEQERRAKLETIKAELLATGEVQSANFYIKTPRGTRDYDPNSTVLREEVLQSIREVFMRHGAVTLDTPTFELRQTLMGKYGDEAANIVFHLEDQGDELLSLRYDLTVPFARYLTMHGLKKMKRFQIGKVFRHERTATTQGRYREFYQCDFDIAGQHDAMLPEVECLKIVNEVLKKLEITQFCIHLNHRLLLEGIFEVSGISPKLFKTVCSTIDKLDKSSWEKVEARLRDKGLNSEQTDKLAGLVLIRQTNAHLRNEELIEKMRDCPDLVNNEKFKKAIDELKLLIKYCELLGVENVKLEPSLARGLDYYTGAIYEVVGDASEAGQLGSLAAGGRYDELVNMFNPTAQVPCCGVSFGTERLFAIKEARHKMQENRIEKRPTEVFVASAQKGMLAERLKLCNQLWAADVKTEFSYKVNPRLLDQLQYCEAHQIPLALIVGENELQKGTAKLRIVATREEKEVPINDLVNSIRDLLRQINR